MTPEEMQARKERAEKNSLVMRKIVMPLFKLGYGLSQEQIESVTAMPKSEIEQLVIDVEVAAKPIDAINAVTDAFSASENALSEREDRAFEALGIPRVRVDLAL